MQTVTVETYLLVSPIFFSLKSVLASEIGSGLDLQGKS